MAMVMNEGVPTMLNHYENMYEPPRRLIFKMPRVVPDQKGKFETDELFKRLSRESEVRYTGWRDSPLEERRRRFRLQCHEGVTEIALVASGTNLQLNLCASRGDVDFVRETGKVHLKSHFILNGVCVRWRGWIDLERLDGVGCVEFDEESARVEEATLRRELEKYRSLLRGFEGGRRNALFKTFHESVAAAK